jgi:DNA-binding MarR family transcriptional regulator
MGFEADETDLDLPNTDDLLDLGSLKTEIGYTLRLAQLTVFRRFFEIFGPEDIKPVQYSTLVIVESNPGVAQGRVAAALSIKKTNFVAMVSGLEVRGLILRQPSSADRRIQGLFLTDTGAMLVRRLRSMARQEEERLISHLGADVYSGLFEPLRQIAKGDY